MNEWKLLDNELSFTVEHAEVDRGDSVEVLVHKLIEIQKLIFLITLWSDFSSYPVISQSGLWFKVKSDKKSIYIGHAEAPPPLP